MYSNWYVLYVLSSILTRPAASQLKRITRTNCCICMLWIPPDDGQ
jgi:hypothetical protein